MPVHRCKVEGCNNFQEEKKYSFFSFPTDNPRSLEWCKILSIPHHGNPASEFKGSHHRICQAHFPSNQYTLKPVLISTALPQARTQDVENCVAFRRQPLSDINFTPPASNSSDHCVDKALKRKVTALSSKREEVKKLRRDLTKSYEKLDTLKNKGLTPKLIEDYFPDARGLMSIIKMQVERHGERANCHYSNLEKTIAVTLFYSCGRNGYRTLQKLGFYLPALSTIRRWICNLKFVPGRNQQILDCLKDKVQLMNRKQRDCILSFDETCVEKGIIYNRSTDSLEGFHNHGPGRTEMKPATQALVLVLRGLNSSWKMPLAFYYSASSTTKDDLHRILSETLDDVSKAGVKVRAVVTDQGATNRSLANELGVTVERPWFMNLNHKVYFMYDAPHIMKCIRNAWRNHGFKAQDTNGVYQPVLWEHLVQFYEKDKNSTVRCCPKLNSKHFEESQSSKMKVKYATQVLSQSVAAGLKTKISVGELSPDVLTTANFVERMNEIFDILNISEKLCPGKPWKSGSYLMKNKDRLLQHMGWVATLKIADGQYIPTLKGLCITLNALYTLSSDLEDEGYRFLLTRRFQSDCVEHLFSLLKFKTNGKPNCQQFRWSFRYVFVSHLLRSPDGANCEEFDQDEILSETMQKIDYLLKTSKKNKPVVEQVENQDEIEASDSEFESGGEDSNDDDRTDNRINEFFRDLNDLDYNKGAQNAVVLMAGWAIKETLRKQECSDCLQLLEWHMDREEPGTDLDETLWENKAYDKKCFERRSALSYGHLLKADTKEVFKHIAEVFGWKLLNSLNMVGTSIVRNAVRELRKEEKVKEWLEGINVSADCTQHRLEVLNLFLRARIHNYLVEKCETL